MFSFYPGVLLCIEKIASCQAQFFLVDYVEERPWWPIQSPKGEEERRKRAAKRIERQDQVY